MDANIQIKKMRAGKSLMSELKERIVNKSEKPFLGSDNMDDQRR